MPNLTNSQEPDYLWPLGAGAARKKIPGAGATWGKNQEPEPEPLEIDLVSKIYIFIHIRK